MSNGKNEDRRGPKGSRFVYHTHNGAWGCIYDSSKHSEAIVMINEVGQPGLTRRIANRLNAGTI